MAQTMTKVATIFSEVMANLAFMFPDQEEVEAAPGDLWLETTISYKGSHCGTLHFRCTREFSFVLASNLLGLEPDDESVESKADDAVKEFLNVVCGQLVTALHGTEEVFNLTIPEIWEMSESPDQTPDGSREWSKAYVTGHQVQFAYESSPGQ